MIKYDKKAAEEIERSYITPEVANQRIRTLEALAPQSGEHLLDIGCGTGFLTQELAMAVGPDGFVAGIDSSLDMLGLARKRCKGLPQVELKQGGVEKLSEQDESFDAVTCVQVLLYVSEVSRALAEMHRVLKPGGRIAVVETDWRGAVLNSSDEVLSRRMLTAWDDAVPSPNLPVRLKKLLGDQGFTAIRVKAIPILITDYTPGNFGVGTLEWIANHAQEQGAVSPTESAAWLEDLRDIGESGSFFFCVNRFLFTAVKQ